MISKLNLSDLVDINRLQYFSKLKLPTSFRYFSNRNFNEAIKTHLLTLLYSLEGKDVGYAHVDFDKNSNRSYLGICVLPEFHGKGIGKSLMEMLCTLYTGELYLTVDKDNSVAISLYKKFKFECIDTMPNYFLFKRNSTQFNSLNSLLLPVSMGEAVDKLSILDIKINKITSEEKKTECMREYDALFPSLRIFIEQNKYLYLSLKYINQTIWDLQDDIRDKDVSTSTNSILHEILDLNDMRFRVKMRINRKNNSLLKEQKGYAARVGLFLSHLGMGDLINMNGAIRYSSLKVDYLFVVCKEKYLENIKDMFSDDPYIEIIPCKDDDSDVMSIVSSDTINNKKITNKYICGIWDYQRNYDDLPNCFYRHLNIPINIKHTFFYCNPSNSLPVPIKPFVFTHTLSSTKNTNIITWNINDIFTIDPNINYYSSYHPWYNEASLYVNKPFFQYNDLIINAKEIHTVDSSFYCLACFLPLKALVKICYDRDTGLINNNYKFN